MFLLFALSFIAKSYQIALYGQSSDYFAIIKQNLDTLSQEMSISQVQSLDHLKNFTSDHPDLLIISEENDLIVFSIQSFCEDNKIPCLFLKSGESSGFSFYLEQNANSKASFIIEAIDALDASNFALIWPFSLDNQEIYLELKALVGANFRHLSVEVGTSVAEISSLLIRIFKSDGIQNFVVLGHGDFCEDVFKGFIAAKLNAEGNMGLFLDECFYQINEEGSLFLVESDLESATTKESYLTTKIYPYLSIFNFSDLSPSKVQQEFSKLSKLNSYSLINTHNFSNTTVGTVSKAKAEINKTIFYYSNVSDRSNFTHARISISANTGTYNPNSPPVFHNKRYHEGTYFAIEKINRDKLFSRIISFIYTIK